MANSVVLADCFAAALDGDEGLDRKAALIRVAEFVNRVCSALTPKK